VYTTTFLKKEDTMQKKKVQKTRSKVRLFVWEGVLRDYTAGIAVAAARSEADARTAILTAAKDDCQLSTLAGQLLAPPTRVMDLPAGAYVCGGG
jgi:hypothetical protein